MSPRQNARQPGSGDDDSYAIWEAVQRLGLYGLTEAGLEKGDAC
jgi:hypothetical protein